MLTETQRKQLVRLLNTVTDIPFLTEDMEASFFENAVTLLDGKMEELLPDSMKNAMRRFLNNSDEGIDGKEASAFSANLVSTLNKGINLPLLNEEQEKMMIQYAADFLMKGMAKGKTLNSILNP